MIVHSFDYNPLIGLTELMPILSDEAQPGHAGDLPEFHPEFEPVVPQAQR